MTLTVKKTKTIETEETIDLNLPAFYKNYGGYFMINEAGSVIKVFLSDDYFCRVVYRNDNIEVQKIINKCEPSNADEFFEAQDKYLALVQSEVLKPV